MKKHYIYILAFLLSFLTLFQSVDTKAQSDLSLSEAKSIVQAHYHGKVNGDIESATSIQQLMNMLDTYSGYYSYDEIIQLLNSIEQKTVGIGIIVEQHTDGISIISVIEGSSAYNGGLKSGDIITQVNGTSIKGYNVDNATALIKGAEGTMVNLTIKRPDDTIFNITLMRNAFTVPVVSSEMLYGNIGYISLSSFSENAAREVKKAAEQLQKQGATSFILDLQNNTGGLVSSAQELISLFPNTKLAYIEQSNNLSKRIAPISLNFKFPNTTRLLINRYSASASEMTAAAVLDQNAAILYGERSYGKGTMQGFYSLSDGSMLKLTQAEFFGPNGTKINQTGITPHVTTASPLQLAHFDALKENLKSYNALKSFSNVPVDKTFTITFSQSVANEIPLDAVELVQLGGQAVATSVTQEGATIKISPVKPLSYGHQYVLIIHPNKLASSNAKILKKGYYSYITVVK